MSGGGLGGKSGALFLKEDKRIPVKSLNSPPGLALQLLLSAAMETVFRCQGISVEWKHLPEGSMG